MQCVGCGGITVDREKVKQKKVVCRYAECRACGRVHIWWRGGEVDDTMPNHEMIGADMMSDDATPSPLGVSPKKILSLRHTPDNL